MPKLLVTENRSNIYRESFDWIIACDRENLCVIFTLTSSFSGTEAPLVSFEIVSVDGDTLYLSHAYTIGKTEETVTNEWKLPPFVFQNATGHIHFKISEGTELRISNYGIRFAESVKPASKPKFNAHLGFYGVAPENTIPAFELAGVCGFDSCITVPKITKDGFFVCIHDDTINKTARDRKGNAPQTEMAVSNMTYEELLKWDFGSWRNASYKNTKIPTLDEFFEICCKYNMKPFFSIHPNFTAEEWQKVRQMLIKYGLLDKFQVKSSKIEVLESVFRVFGNEINCYTLWAMEYCDELIQKLSSMKLDLSKVRGVIEFREKLCTQNFSAENVEKIKAAGFTASALSCWGRKNSEYFRRLISLGVDEFTEDFHCSFDLHW